MFQEPELIAPSTCFISLSSLLACISAVPKSLVSCNHFFWPAGELLSTVESSCFNFVALSRDKPNCACKFFCNCAIFSVFVGSSFRASRKFLASPLSPDIAVLTPLSEFSNFVVLPYISTSNFALLAITYPFFYAFSLFPFPLSSSLQ